MSEKHILLVTVILVAMAVFAVPAAAEHQITFENTCNQDVYINLQGGPQGTCDNNGAACSGCEVCGTDTFGNSIICNTSAVTGNNTPICCPGSNTDMPYCNTGESCIPQGCCPGTIATAGQSYNCPQGGNYSLICGNQTMTQAEIDALSGYNNASTGRHRIACSGSLIAGGGFKIDARTGSQTYNFPDAWNGAFFPRTGCTFDENGFGNCNTGNCIDQLNRGLLQCGGAGSAAPVVKAEINFGNTWVDVDNYDMSFVNGFNVAMVFTPTQHNTSYVGQNKCTAAGCAVNLSSFTSPRVPSWDMLKYTSISNFIGIMDDGDYFYSTHNMTGDPYNGPNAGNYTLFWAYSCPIAEGYVNDSTISCADVPAGKTCKTCAGQNTNLFPFNQSGALPNSANLFFDTCPNAYAYTYNDTAALMTCNGANPTTETNYKITVSCDGGTVAPPVASFTSTPTSGTAPLTVTYTDSSTNSPTSWSWSFGDGSSSTLQNPSHTYTSAGTYTVALTATNSAGSNILTRTNYITVTSPSATSAVGVFRSGTFYRNGATPIAYGLSTDTPVTGDWNGDGTTEVGVFRSGTFYLNGYNGLPIAYGLSTDLPVTGDWNGDTHTEVGVFRSGTFYLNVNGVTTSVPYGLSTDTPVTGDWNGDGTTEVGVFRSGTFYRNGATSVAYGVSTDTPVTGDWNGDGITEVGVFRSGMFYLNGGTSVAYGVASDTPVTGKWV